MIKSNTIYNVSEEEENDIATKIQAGYRGMKVRESVKDKAAKDGKEADADDSGTELSGATSPEDGKVTVVENDNPRTVGIDSGTSFSSREVTPRDATPVTPVIESDIGKDENNQCSEEEVPDRGKAVEDESEEEEGDSEYTDEGESESEEEAQVAKNRTPFILLKQLVGIMKLGGGKRILPDMKEKAISGEVVRNVGNGLITENGDAGKGNIIKENKNASLETVVKESVENIVKESVEDVVKESVQNVVKENVENVVKENVENVVKENIDNVLEKGVENVVKEDVENVVKENVQNIKKDVKEIAENVDKENVEVKESVENVVKESVKENVEDVAKERV